MKLINVNFNFIIDYIIENNTDKWIDSLDKRNLCEGPDILKV